MFCINIFPYLFFYFFVTPFTFPPLHSPTKPAEETTLSDYDMAQLKKLLQSTVMGVLMTSGLHFYMGFVPPLFIQGVTGALPFLNK